MADATPAMMRQIAPEEAAGLLARLLTEWERSTGYLVSSDGNSVLEVGLRTETGGLLPVAHVHPTPDPNADGWSIK